MLLMCTDPSSIAAAWVVEGVGCGWSIKTFLCCCELSLLLVLLLLLLLGGEEGEEGESAGMVIMEGCCPWRVARRRRACSVGVEGDSGEDTVGKTVEEEEESGEDAGGWGYDPLAAG